eukprot:TRINITY_DN2150_c0_g1_i4.p1 TRINITY_DN2150_c0_g1~~TRINITY_DN2150_c0_g1_i4.p1  ORF type:complete len:768 (+),score=171.95 TRINITY_DN2150_c0_g1_i4:181-2304(+)
MSTSILDSSSPSSLSPQSISIGGTPTLLSRSKYDDDNDTSSPSTPSTSVPSLDDSITEDTLPVERIIFCIDLDREIDFPFKNKPRLEHVQKAIRMFVRVKLLDQPQTQFALMVLRTAAIWQLDFTNDYSLFKDKLSGLTCMEEQVTECDMTTLFDQVEYKLNESSRHTTSKTREGPSRTYCNRVILFYSRTSTQPKYLGGKNSLERLLATPNFHYDGVYMYHGNIPNQSEIFAALTPSPASQIHKVADLSSIRKFYYCVLGLLYVHPTIRPASPKYLRFPVGLINFWMCTLFGYVPDLPSSSSSGAGMGSNSHGTSHHNPPTNHNNNHNNNNNNHHNHNNHHNNHHNHNNDHHMPFGAPQPHPPPGINPAVMKHPKLPSSGPSPIPIPATPAPPAPGSIGYDLKYYLYNNEGSDVIFEVGASLDKNGRSVAIPGHKLILCARSSYFRALLTNGMRESAGALMTRSASPSDEKDSIMRIKLPNIAPHLFRMVFCYLYTGDVPSSMFVPPSSSSLASSSSSSSSSSSARATPYTIAMDLLMLADQYLVDGLKQRCCIEIMHHISPENITWLMQVAEQHAANDLRRACMWHFFNHLPDYLKEKDFPCDGYDMDEYTSRNTQSHPPSESDAEVDLAALIVHYFSRVAGLVAPSSSSSITVDDADSPAAPNEQGTMRDFQELIELFLYFNVYQLYKKKKKKKKKKTAKARTG